MQTLYIPLKNDRYLDSGCSYQLATSFIRFAVKVSIRPYMIHVSKPTIEIKDVARISKQRRDSLMFIAPKQAAVVIVLTFLK